MSLAKSMIELQDVSKIYQLDKRRSVQAVKKLNLSVDKDEFVVITGRSGCGKTTLLNLISGLTNPTTGRVFLDQVEVWKLPDLEQSLLRNKKIGFVFQFPSLMPSLTALENVILPTIVKHNGDPSITHESARDLLAEVGLADKIDSYPRQLSAGQQQRVVIARSLINQPELLLADEPTSNLDEQTEREIMALFREIHQQKNITILLVTHTIELVHYGTQSLQMSDGRIVS
jgi:putative ABC transport system ATP-binding protein/lipoprotein-releasing system ATP-binding protein